MPKEVYFDGKASRRGRINQTWFKDFHKYLLALIQSSHIVIATDKEDQDFILGYAIFNHSQLEFVYVKEAYRQQGIGTMLIHDVPYESINEKNMTKLGRKILDQQAQPKEHLLAKQDEKVNTDPVVLTCTPPPAMIDQLKANGIPVINVTFQSAILSGFNAAENRISTISTNKMRNASGMWYTTHGLIIEQNNHRLIVPLANVIQADEMWFSLKRLS